MTVTTIASEHATLVSEALTAKGFVQDETFGYYTDSDLTGPIKGFFWLTICPEVTIEIPISQTPEYGTPI